MPKLPPNQNQPPDGLFVAPDFITQSEELELLDKLLPILGTVQHVRHDGNRSRILRYGWSYFEDKQWLGKAPDWLYLNGKIPRLFESITVNEYEPGSAIAKHVDSFLFDDAIHCLSLQSDAVMRFTRGESSYDVNVNRLGLATMSGESRYKWVHEILPVTEIRYSIIYRHRL